VLATAPRYYSEQQHLAALGVRQLRTAKALPEALRLLAVYQASAALLASEHGAEALREQGIPGDGATLVPAAFTIVPSAPSVLDDVDPGPQFDRIVATLISDAGRSAMGTFTATRDRQVGSIRQLTPPSCSRCAVLAGRWYRWSEGFQRHPRCDCVMIPGTRDAATYDPYEAYQRGEVTDLTAAQRKAIDAGADINQVVNARRGMQTVSFAGRRVAVTTEGTTARGLAFRSLSARGTTTARFETGTRPVTRTIARAPRLSPEAIYNVSDGDRQMAIRLLRANGYIL
jgi:hypothetical protein